VVIAYAFLRASRFVGLGRVRSPTPATTAARRGIQIAHHGEAIASVRDGARRRNGHH